MTKRKQKAFDVTVDFCGLEADTPEEAAEQVREMLRNAFDRVPIHDPRAPWIVTKTEEV